MALFSQNGLTYVVCLSHLTLSERISLSLDLYPCDLLFVHRDAEGDLQHVRTEEIHQALAAAAQRVQIPPTVCVVPVRMQKPGCYSMSKRSAGQPGIRMAAPRLYCHPLTRSHSFPMQSVSSMICYVKPVD